MRGRLAVLVQLVIQELGGVEEELFDVLARLRRGFGPKFDIVFAHEALGCVAGDLTLRL